MHSQIRSYVASCEVCQRYKRIMGSHPDSLSPITPPEAVFNTIGMDHVGPLPTAADGNHYIIVAVDYLSKYVEVAAVPSVAASHVIEFPECPKCQYQTAQRLSVAASYALFFAERKSNTILRPPITPRLTALQKELTRGFKHDWHRTWRPSRQGKLTGTGTFSPLLTRSTRPSNLPGKNPVRTRLRATSDIGRRGQFGHSRQSRLTCRSAGGVPQY